MVFDGEAVTLGVDLGEERPRAARPGQLSQHMNTHYHFFLFRNFKDRLTRTLTDRSSWRIERNLF